MALDTYAELQAAILGWLARPGDPLVAPAVPDMIRLFEAEAGRRLRVIDAERVISIPLIVAEARDVVMLPYDCWSVRLVLWDDQPLEFLPLSSTVFNEGGVPGYYSLFGQNDGGEGGITGTWIEFNMLLGPRPDYDGTVTVFYQVGVPWLSGSRPTNWLLQSHPDAYLFGALAEAEGYIGHDERIQLWLQRREAAFASIETHDRKARWGGPMQIRAAL